MIFCTFSRAVFARPLVLSAEIGAMSVGKNSGNPSQSVEKLFEINWKSLNAF